MNTTELAAALKQLGWVATGGTLVFRTWTNITRPGVVIHVPRGTWVDPDVALRILRRARATRF